MFVLLANEQYLLVGGGLKPQLSCVQVLFIATEDSKKINAPFVCLFCKLAAFKSTVLDCYGHFGGMGLGVMNIALVKMFLFYKVHCN